MQTKPVVSTVLRLRWPLGPTFVLAAVIAVCLGGVLELAARSEALRRRLPPESVGSGQAQLDKKLVLLRQMVQKRGPVDCLLIGSSQVYRAVDPDILRGVFKQFAGRDMRVFNFGLGGMTETGLPPLARILEKKYRPGMMIVGVSSYGLDDRRDLNKFQDFLASSSWFRYHKGALSLEGWLIDRSFALRQYQGHLFWSDLTPEKVRLFRRGIANMRDDGYGFLRDEKFRAFDAEVAKELEDYRISPMHLEMLSEVLKLKSPSTEVLVVEVPVHESVTSRFGRGELDHKAAMDAVQQVADRHGVVFFRYPADRPIPQDGWIDFIHMNRVGADFYSRWLGERVGMALRQGRLKLHRN